MRTIKQEMDVDDFGKVSWVISFSNNNEDKFTLSFGDMTSAREAGRRWLVGTANTAEELKEQEEA